MAITIEELERKAKAYDEALESAKEIVNNKHASSVWKDWLRNTFPELKESEDEKIRKLLIKLFKSNTNEKFYDVSTQEIIAWLEKLDKKLTDCVVPHKYNVGDWIVSKYGSIYQVKTIMTGSYNLLCASNTEEINSISQVDNSSRLLCMKDIQDMLKQSKPVKWSAKEVAKETRK